MSLWGKVTLALTVLMLAYSVLIFGTAFQIQNATGAMILDMRMFGTTPESVGEFIAALDQTGNHDLHNKLRKLDLLYPIIYGGFGLACSVWLYRGRTRFIVALFPIFAAFADLSENHMIKTIITQGGVPEAEIVARMSMFTHIKYAMIALGSVALTFGVFRLIRNKKEISNGMG